MEVTGVRKVWSSTMRRFGSSWAGEVLGQWRIKTWFGKTWFGKIRTSAIFLCIWMPLFSQNAMAASAQLIMVEETGCAFCARFNDEIAPIYPNTAEGSVAPLRRINIDEGWPDDLSHIDTESLTPTFILIQDNQELGRLYGYQGDEFFWFLLGELLEKLKPATDKAH